MPDSCVRVKRHAGMIGTTRAGPGGDKIDQQEGTQFMKSLRITLLFALVMALALTATAADFGVRAGRYSDSEQDFVGADLLIDLGSINLVPNIEYVLDNEITAGSLNLDVTVDLAHFGAATPYLGAGVGLSYLDDDFGGEETTTLGNLIGGVGFDLGRIDPYAQVKYFRNLEDDDAGDDVALTVGIRF